MFESIRNKKQERIFKAHFRCGPVCIENGRFRNEALLKISAPNAMTNQSEIEDTSYYILKLITILYLLYFLDQWTLTKILWVISFVNWSPEWWSWNNPLINFTDEITSWLTVMEYMYLFHRRPLTSSNCRDQCPILFSTGITCRIDIPPVLYLYKQRNGCHMCSRLCLPFRARTGDHPGLRWGSGNSVFTISMLFLSTVVFLLVFVFF